jgi:hypothetical protein
MFEIPASWITFSTRCWSSAFHCILSSRSLIWLICPFHSAPLLIFGSPLLIPTCLELHYHYRRLFWTLQCRLFRIDSLLFLVKQVIRTIKSQWNRFHPYQSFEWYSRVTIMIDYGQGIWEFGRTPWYNISIYSDWYFSTRILIKNSEGFLRLFSFPFGQIWFHVRIFELEPSVNH